MSLETLSNNEKINKIKIYSKIRNYTQNFFHDNDFIEIGPLMLGKSVDPLGPDPGSSIVGIPDIEYQGQRLNLMTSMILHKQAAVGDLQRLFVMSPNIRLEADYRKKTGQHLFEFTQADFEIANAKTDDVLSLLEDYYKRLTGFLKTNANQEFEELPRKIFDFKPPFERHTTHELKDKYGSDWESKASKDKKQPFWVLDHQREFYDKEDPENEGHYLNYDLVYPFGFGEAISGAEREHEYSQIIYRIERDGLDTSKYEAYLEHAERGFSPSAGAGIGIERLARFLTNSKHVGDVTVFKRIPGVPVDL